MINSTENSKKNNFFKVPDGYFESLQDAVMKKVNEHDKHKRILKKRIFAISSIAASLLLILGITFSVMYETPVVNSEKQLAYNQPKESINPTSASLDNSGIEKEEVIPSTPSSAEKTMTAATPRPHNIKKEEPIEVDLVIDEEEFNDIDYQILDNYSDDIVFYDYF